MDNQELMKRLLPLVTNQLWERMEDYLNYERSKLIDLLIKSHDIRQINKVQGQVHQIELLLALPNQIKRVVT